MQVALWITETAPGGFTAVEVRGVDGVGRLVDRDAHRVDPVLTAAGPVMVAGVWPQPVLFVASQVAPLITYPLPVKAALPPNMRLVA